mmetsp:Transcript_18918/g.26072  ORF Transcript_18918/g.26072 Transcript_18918/m.26072 type:complete len:1248 (+) Transcript_18918:2-3745(+)
MEPDDDFYDDCDFEVDFIENDAKQASENIELSTHDPQIKCGDSTEKNLSDYSEDNHPPLDTLTLDRSQPIVISPRSSNTTDEIVLLSVTLSENSATTLEAVTQNDLGFDPSDTAPSTTPDLPNSIPNEVVQENVTPTPITKKSSGHVTFLDNDVYIIDQRRLESGHSTQSEVGLPNSNDTSGITNSDECDGEYGEEDFADYIISDDEEDNIKTVTNTIDPFVTAPEGLSTLTLTISTTSEDSPAIILPSGAIPVDSWSKDSDYDRIKTNASTSFEALLEDTAVEPTCSDPTDANPFNDPWSLTSRDSELDLLNKSFHDEEPVSSLVVALAQQASSSSPSVGGSSDNLKKVLSVKGLLDLTSSGSAHYSSSSPGSMKRPFSAAPLLEHKSSSNSVSVSQHGSGHSLGLKRSMTDSYMRVIMDFADTAASVSTVMDNLDIAVPSAMMDNLTLASNDMTALNMLSEMDLKSINGNTVEVMRHSSRGDLGDVAQVISNDESSPRDSSVPVPVSNRAGLRSGIYSSIHSSSLKMKEMVEEAAHRATVMVDSEQERLHKEEMTKLMEAAASFAIASASSVTEHEEEVDENGHAKGLGFRSLKAGLKKMDVKLKTRHVAPLELKRTMTADVVRRLSKMVCSPNQQSIIAAAAAAAVAAVAESPVARNNQRQLKTKKEDMDSIVNSIRMSIDAILEDDSDANHKNGKNWRKQPRDSIFFANKLSRSATSSSLLQVNFNKNSLSPAVLSDPIAGPGSSLHTNLEVSDDSSNLNQEGGIKKLVRRNSAPVTALETMVNGFAAANASETIIHHAYPKLTHSQSISDQFKEIRSESYIEKSGYRWAKQKKSSAEVPMRRKSLSESGDGNSVNKVVDALLKGPSMVDTHLDVGTSSFGGSTKSKISPKSLVMLSMTSPIVYSQEELMDVSEFAAKVQEKVPFPSNAKKQSIEMQQTAGNDPQTDSSSHEEELDLYADWGGVKSLQLPNLKVTPTCSNTARYRMVKLLKSSDPVIMLDNEEDADIKKPNLDHAKKMNLLPPDAEDERDPMTLSKVLRPARSAKPMSWSQVAKVSRAGGNNRLLRTSLLQSVAESSALRGSSSTSAILQDRKRSITDNSPSVPIPTEAVSTSSAFDSTNAHQIPPLLSLNKIQLKDKQQTADVSAVPVKQAVTRRSGSHSRQNSYAKGASDSAHLNTQSNTDISSANQNGSALNGNSNANGLNISNLPDVLSHIKVPRPRMPLLIHVLNESDLKKTKKVVAS